MQLIDFWRIDPDHVGAVGEKEKPPISVEIGGFAGAGGGFFAAQGGDWRNAVSEQMALQTLQNCSVSTPTCPRQFRPTSARR
jgi:hypothetical protein